MGLYEDWMAKYGVPPPENVFEETGDKPDWNNWRGTYQGGQFERRDPPDIYRNPYPDSSGPYHPQPSGPGSGGGEGGGSPEFTYQTPPYGGPMRPNYNFEDVPQFEAPEFAPPDADAALNEPGYRFRLDESLKALERSAAAKGVLRGGGTLSGITERAGNMASAEYGNVWNRALQSHQEAYRGATDEYMPNLLEWQTLTAAEQRAGDSEWQRAWDAYVFGIDDVWRREHMIYTTPM